MAENVSLNIILTDDGQPAQRPALPPGVGASPPSGGGGGDDFRAAIAALLKEFQGFRRGARPPANPKGGGGEDEGPKASDWMRQAGMGKSADLVESIGDLRKAGSVMEGIGPAIAVASAASKLLASAMDGTRKTVEEMGKVASDFARNDHMAMFNRAVDNTAATLEKIPIVGGAAASALSLLAAPARAFADTVQSFIERGKQLAAYSPELSMSGAKAEVTSMMADMREAQELGSGISRMTDAQTELFDMLRETLLPIKRWLVDVLASMMETLVQLAKDGYAVGMDIYTFLQTLPELIAQKMAGTKEGVAEAFRQIKLDQEGWRLRQKIKAEEKKNPVDHLVDQMMAEINARGVGLPGRDALVPGGG